MLFWVLSYLFLVAGCFVVCLLEFVILTKEGSLLVNVDLPVLLS